MFQFHNGAIKSFGTFSVVALGSGFNSTMVRLKVGLLDNSQSPKSRFNSTMVRLKVKTNDRSKKGEKRFNSTMVRLKA